jgi:hypothetical protein
MTLEQVRERLAQLPRNGHTSANERRERSKVGALVEQLVAQRLRFGLRQPVAVVELLNQGRRVPAS